MSREKTPREKHGTAQDRLRLAANHRPKEVSFASCLVLLASVRRPHTVKLKPIAFRLTVNTLTALRLRFKLQWVCHLLPFADAANSNDYEIRPSPFMKGWKGHGLVRNPILIKTRINDQPPRPTKSRTSQNEKE